jgi:hypothetical protein
MKPLVIRIPELYAKKVNWKCFNKKCYVFKIQGTMAQQILTEWEEKGNSI